MQVLSSKQADLYPIRKGLEECSFLVKRQMTNPRRSITVFGDMEIHWHTLLGDRLVARPHTRTLILMLRIDYGLVN